MPHSGSSSNTAVETLLQDALRAHRSGRLQEAAALYESILRQHPHHGDALHLLGTLALQTGHAEQALALLTAAIQANPANADYRNSLGGALHRSGHLPEALDSFEQALILNPNFASACLNRGYILEDLQQLEAAAESYRRAGELDRTLLDAHLKAGAVLLKLQRPEDAMAACRRALRLAPESAAAHFHYGHACEAKAQWNAAALSYQKAIQLNPQMAEAHNNLGNVRRMQHDLEGAIAEFSVALALRPDFAVAEYNLATALSEKKDFAQAIPHYFAAIALKPDFADAYYNLGNAFRDDGRADEAKKAYAQALGINPQFAVCYTALGAALTEQGSYDKAIACYEESLRLEPDNAETYFDLSAALRGLAKLPEAAACLHRALELNPGCTKAYSNLLYQHATTRDVSPEEERRWAEGWERCALSDAERTAARNVTFHRAPLAGRKLRLGILSAEIGQHAVSEFLEPLLTGIDRERFHVTLFPSILRKEPRTVRMLSQADAVNAVENLSDKAAAELIRAADIDVLVETTGHTRDCRLGICAHRAAPVQVSYIGYWSTTGLTEMDWVFGDRDTPSAFETHFRERIWRLPRLAVCYRGDASLPTSGWQPAARGTIWLGSLNRFIKIREATLALWARVMHSLPEAKLLLEDREIDSACQHERILRELSGHGIAAERVCFEPHIPGHERHMRLYDRLDIALDTIPFNSGTTACDALWMGVPLVALDGDWAGGRIAASLLRAAGKEEWIARDEEEYAAIVTRLARDVAGRMQLRTAQREQVAKSELCDSRGLTCALQDAFLAMFEEFQTANLEL